ncbi:hypothetical protein [Listeria sp. PSOL-1]|uniref:hypothetical protein n=1 Tax=Listeria sp. PSOL-1 TaxID=1844999 RepID=UPI0013D47F14|nr:hypothetical protein [Listeria sp. PSOL-1]
MKRSRILTILVSLIIIIGQLSGSISAFAETKGHDITTKDLFFEENGKKIDQLDLTKK